MTRTLAALAFAMTVGAAGAAFPQTSPPASVTPGAGIPSAQGGAADRTGSITGTGQTKPPGSPVGERMGTTPELERKSGAIDHLIERGICKGC